MTKIIIGKLYKLLGASRPWNFDNTLSFGEVTKVCSATPVNLKITSEWCVAGTHDGIDVSIGSGIVPIATTNHNAHVCLVISANNDQPKVVCIADEYLGEIGS